MIDLTDVRRVRLHRGTRTHRTGKAGTGLFTGCDKRVKLDDLIGRPLDQPLPPESPITCTACLAAPEPNDHAPEQEN